MTNIFEVIYVEASWKTSEDDLQPKVDNGSNYLIDITILGMYH